ncbi:MAG TPA: sulfite exporter TauE/SafE family protein, partial [Propionibacteriaceae bacterium]|nr:sulfite exporter TauE/SafE family protein [Propionibacteriaceae bacterium]
MISPSTNAVAAPARARSLWPALTAGGGVGLLGGLIGLGGAEFRLPLLIGLFGFAALQAVIMNKAMSLIVVMTALPARLLAVPFDTVNGYWFVVVNLLAGSLVGAWIGATWATRMRSATLYRVLAVLLVLIAVALAWNHFGDLNPVFLDPVPRTLLGLAAGVGIGIVAALMGVA